MSPAPGIGPHDHAFGQDVRRPGERRTFAVIALTAATMVVEIAAGLAFGSMALLADGLHMASHAVALGVSAFAYVYARRHAHDRRFSFGTGKVNALGGFTGALLLALFAAGMAFESAGRLSAPIPIAFDQAIAVAVLGLIINGASVFALGFGHGHGHSHGGPAHAQDHHGGDHHHDHDHHHHHHHHHGDHRHHDHNLRSAYLHVLADALTSLLAIVALLAAKLLGWIWMDAAMGIVGAVLVARWSYGLLRASSHVLLDRQGPDELCRAVRDAIEAGGSSEIFDLHVWSIGPGIHAAAIAVVTEEDTSPERFRARLPPGAGIVHASIEVHRDERPRPGVPAG